MNESEKTKLQLTSIESEKRPGQYAVVAVYCIAWLFVVVWYGVAWATYDNSPGFALLIAVVDTAFLVYLFFASSRLHNRLENQYVVEVTDKAVHYFRINSDTNDRMHKCLQLDEIVRGEVYRYQDSGSIILESKSGEKMEIPTWCLPRRGEDLIECMENIDVKLVYIN